MSKLLSGLARSVIVVAALTALAIPGVAGAKAGDPPGSNGTIKVDGVDFDVHPDNEPHVGCIFQVDFYGFDQGNFVADVTFTIHPPSGRRVAVTDRVFIGEDRAGGGTDLDAERDYDLNLDVFARERHPRQGFHVRLDVAAPGVGGKVATKSKVFWLRDCVDP